MSASPILEVKNLKISFPVYGGVLRHKVAEVRAVDDVTLTLHEGEVLGLVGESGSGKTTVGRAIINILRSMSHDVQLEGQVLLHTGNGTVDLNGLKRKEMLPYRSQVAMIFQDPYSSLNPRMTVQQIVEGPLKIQMRMAAPERKKRVAELLERVGLQADYASRYPHEFSGGQRQRIGIARALTTHPRIIIADEPVSALDVSVRAQVINLMEELKKEFKLSYIFIAHDLSVVYHVSDRIAVMYLGSLVELGSAEQVYRDPRHPYSKALLSAVPQPDPDHDRNLRQKLEGDIPTPLSKPSGCGFRTRCPLAQESCKGDAPPLGDVGEGHYVACPIIE